MLPSTLRDPGVYVDVVAGYRRHAPGRVALPSHVFVAESGARERWRPYLQAYASFASPWRGDGRAIDVDALMEGAAICGEPSEVADRLNAQQKLLGLDAHLVLIDIGGLPPDEVLAAIRLFGEKVIPQLTG